jgi:hypothetical protein
MPLYLSYGSDLAYRENIVRTSHVLDYVHPSSLINVLIKIADCLLPSPYAVVCKYQLSVETTFV